MMIADGFHFMMAIAAIGTFVLILEICIFDGRWDIRNMYFWWALILCQNCVSTGNAFLWVWPLDMCNSSGLGAGLDPNLNLAAHPCRQTWPSILNHLFFAWRRASGSSGKSYRVYVFTGTPLKVAGLSPLFSGTLFKLSKWPRYLSSVWHCVIYQKCDLKQVQYRSFSPKAQDMNYKLANYATLKFLLFEFLH